MSRGIITLYVGVMASGKSSYMINEIRKARYASFLNFVFVHSNNHKKDTLVSRMSDSQTKDGVNNGLLEPAKTVTSSDEIFDTVKNHLDNIKESGLKNGFMPGKYKINVFVDEVQFFDDGILTLFEYFRHTGLNVYGSGLALNYIRDLHGFLS